MWRTQGCVSRSNQARYLINSKLKALAVAGASSEKKGLDIVTVDMRKMSSVCDYFVISSGTSTTQVRAIAENIARRLEEKGMRVRHAEGEREGLWVLLDCGDVVAHIFLDQTRRFYNLEQLWSKAPQERYKETRPKGAAGRPRAQKAARRARPHKRLRKKTAAKGRSRRKLSGRKLRRKR